MGRVLVLPKECSVSLSPPPADAPRVPKRSFLAAAPAPAPAPAPALPSGLPPIGSTEPTVTEAARYAQLFAFLSPPEQQPPGVSSLLLLGLLLLHSLLSKMGEGSGAGETQRSR